MNNESNLDSRLHRFRTTIRTSIVQVVKDIFKSYNTSCLFVIYWKAFETTDQDIVLKCHDMNKLTTNITKTKHNYVI